LTQNCGSIEVGIYYNLSGIFWVPHVNSSILKTLYSKDDLNLSVATEWLTVSKTLKDIQLKGPW